MRKLIVAAVLLVSGCGPAPNETVPETATTTAAPDAPKPRLISTAELAKAAGAECKGPKTSIRRGGTADQEFYVLTCRNGSLLVSINMDGSTKILDCKLAAALSTPCDKSWD